MWQTTGKTLTADFTFADFRAALFFVNKVGEAAEAVNHHPDIFLHEYNKVKIILSTHDRGGVTEKDRALARGIEKIFKETL